MLTSAQAAVLNNKLALQLKSIGDMMCPPSTNNTESYAWDYYIANKIEAYGKKAKDVARKMAIKNGVMFDHEKEPREPGTEADVYNGDVIRISLTVKEPNKTFDHKAFLSCMEEILPPDKHAVLQTFYLGAFKTSRPAHTFTATLLSE